LISSSFSLRKYGEKEEGRREGKELKELKE
jgi:hypothetical protein